LPVPYIIYEFSRTNQTAPSPKKTKTKQQNKKLPKLTTYTLD